MTGFSPSSEARAIAAAGLKAGLGGSAIVGFLLAGGFAFGGSEFSFHSIYVSIWIGGAAFIISSVIGTIAVLFCLLIFGLPLAGLARTHLEGASGVAVALTAAFFVSALLAGIYGSPESILIILAYAVPAAILYRREILLERIFE